MPATLQTEFLGVSMPNPFMLASAPPSTNPECIARAFDAGWGGAVIKTVQYTPRFIKQNVTPRICAYRNGSQIMGFTNFEIGSPKTLDQWAEGIRWLKERYPDRAVFASLIHADVINENEWREVTRIFDQAGADGFELNLSCSHGQAENGGGAAIGVNEDMIRKVVSWVRTETSKPVMPKMTAMTMDIQSKGLAAKEAGADALAAINTINSLPGVDLNTFVPYNSVGGMSAYQGMSGRVIKPLALRSVAQLAAGTRLPISASGGIYTWRDAAEFISLGAHTLQACSVVMERGYGVIDELTRGLLDYMEEKGFETLEDFRGKALLHIGKQIELDRKVRLKAQNDVTKCIGCGKCMISCADNGYGAISMEGKKAFVYRDQCDGCGLCTQICPVGSLHMTREEV